ncbi:MAG: MFS transporter [Acidiferrobacteraceae bacterium]
MANEVFDPRERSLHHVVNEGVMFSVMSGFGDMYFSAYALFLKMTAAQIGFLSAIPALLGSTTQLLSAWIGQRTGYRKRIVLTGVTLQAAMWVPIMVLPYLFPHQAGLVIILCIVLYYGGNNLAAPLWGSLLGDLVPADRRGRYFGRRSKIMNFANFLALVSAGIVLNYWRSRSLAGIGFLIIFTVAMAARLSSAYQVSRIIEPVPLRHPQPTHSIARMLLDLRKTPFARFSVFMALVNFSASIAGPFFAIHMLRNLHFSYLEFMASTAVVVLMQFLSLSNWGHLADRYGNRRILSVTAFIVPLLPALWLFTGSFTGIMLIQLLSGFAWSGFNLSASNYIYDAVAPNRRSSYVAAHNVLGSIATFAGAALGAHLSIMGPAHLHAFGLYLSFGHTVYWLFLLSALARLNTAFAMIPLMPELRDVEPCSAARLLWAASGLERAAALIVRVLGLGGNHAKRAEPRVSD